MLGFSENEVGHFTFKKWSLLFNHFKVYHNFFISQKLFEEKGEITYKNSDEWLPN